MNASVIEATILQRRQTTAEEELMITLDHVRFAVADYQRSKASYEKRSRRSDSSS